VCVLTDFRLFADLATAALHVAKVPGAWIDCHQVWFGFELGADMHVSKGMVCFGLGAVVQEMVH